MSPDETDAKCEDMLRHALGDAFNGFRRIYEGYIKEARKERDQAVRERDLAQAHLRHAQDMLDRSREEVPA